MTPTYVTAAAVLAYAIATALRRSPYDPRWWRVLNAAWHASLVGVVVQAPEQLQLLVALVSVVVAVMAGILAAVMHRPTPFEHKVPTQVQVPDILNYAKRAEDSASLELRDAATRIAYSNMNQTTHVHARH